MLVGINFRNGELIYLRSNEANEFWSPLLEKAYAKLKGSYKALTGGVGRDAAVDLTGGIPQVIKIPEDQINKENKILLDKLKLVFANKALICTSLRTSGRHLREAERYGLQKNHVYTVTKLVDVSRWYQRQSKPLIR